MPRAERWWRDDRRVCARTRSALAGADGPTSLTIDGRAHLDRCLRCQAEAGQYRRLHRALGELSATPAPAEPGVLTSVLATLDAYDTRLARRAAAIARATVVGGVVAVATAGAAGAVVAARVRRHRVRLAG
jgi:hypothetical protein